MTFLDSIGFTHLWGIIEDRLALKVDAVAGKGLSTNDFTTQYKKKLEAVPFTKMSRAIEKTSSTSGAMPVTGDEFTIWFEDNELYYDENSGGGGGGGDTGSYEFDRVERTFSINFSSEFKQRLNNFVSKDEIGNAVTYKGSVANEAALPTENLKVGDMYNLLDTDMNVAWTGTKWDPMGATVTVSAMTNDEIDAIVAAFNV